MVNCWRCYCITNERVMNLSIFLLARLESCDSEHSLAAGAMPALRLLSNLLPAEADVFFLQQHCLALFAGRLFLSKQPGEDSQSLQ